MAKKDPGDPAIKAFAKTHAGDTIAFDGTVGNIGPDGDKKTMVDVLVLGGDDENTATGPQWQLEHVELYGDDFPAASRHFNAKVHVVAMIDDYLGPQQLLQLYPAKMTRR